MTVHLCFESNLQVNTCSDWMIVTFYEMPYTCTSYAWDSVTELQIIYHLHNWQLQFNSLNILYTCKWIFCAAFLIATFKVTFCIAGLDYQVCYTYLLVLVPFLDGRMLHHSGGWYLQLLACNEISCKKYFIWCTFCTSVLYK